MLLPVVCPLLITAGHCAEFVYKESEDLADLQAITPPSEQHHRLHLSLWSVSKKSAKSLTKTIGKSTQIPHVATPIMLMLLPDSCRLRVRRLSTANFN
ncbi:hypothetical protein [Salmonella phage ZBSTP8]|nr:hypothetical protein [Salmonella phage ZBSTP8]